VIVAGTGGEGGGGGSLPVTGAQAGLIGGIGAVVVALGAVLFFVARRRKVVLVTPQDEKSAE
jgi:LPXTG-motif cell wall-anchored protein